MENNIPTAEEFATEHNEAKMPRGVSYQKEIGELMIEFAKLHCEAQLKAILEKAEAINQAKFKGDCNPQIDAESIINAYDLNQIK